jgi:(4-(4-[2-(gamma-L-glutamylamino)ethyl]phenoxymethyl)furan-2-yl)methanamine synthase
MSFRKVAEEPEKFFGIDVGGAHLKISTAGGQAASIPFPMWTDWHRLGPVVRELVTELADEWTEDLTLAITMTGELADCFESRRLGVAAILDGLTSVVPAEQCRVYAVGGAWLTVQEAKENPWSVAASNWHALAEWCLRTRPAEARQWSAIVDIGSTTVDIVPIHHGTVVSRAATDRQRLQAGQLVYTGMERTPIHAIVRRLWVDGKPCPVMAEKFATISDVNLVLGAVAEEPENCDSADGRPRTRYRALGRLARMVGEDIESLPEESIVALAEQIADAQASQVRRALVRNLPQPSPPSIGNSPIPSDNAHLRSYRDQAVNPPVRVLVSGHGRPLIQRIAGKEGMQHINFEYLDRFISPMASRCAPALAVAWLCCYE